MVYILLSLALLLQGGSAIILFPNIKPSAPWRRGWTGIFGVSVLLTIYRLVDLILLTLGSVQHTLTTSLLSASTALLFLSGSIFAVYYSRFHMRKDFNTRDLENRYNTLSDEYSKLKRAIETEAQNNGSGWQAGASKLFQEFFQSINHPAFLCKGGLILRGNRAILDLLEVAPGDVANQPIDTFVQGLQGTNRGTCILKSLHHKTPVNPETLPYLDTNGEIISLLILFPKSYGITDTPKDVASLERTLQAAESERALYMDQLSQREAEYQELQEKFFQLQQLHTEQGGRAESSQSVVALSEQSVYTEAEDDSLESSVYTAQGTASELNGSDKEETLIAEAASLTKGSPLGPDNQDPELSSLDREMLEAQIADLEAQLEDQAIQINDLEDEIDRLTEVIEQGGEELKDAANSATAEHNLHANQEDHSIGEYRSLSEAQQREADRVLVLEKELAIAREEIINLLTEASLAGRSEEQPVAPLYTTLQTEATTQSVAESAEDSTVGAQLDIPFTQDSTATEPEELQAELIPPTPEEFAHLRGMVYQLEAENTKLRQELADSVYLTEEDMCDYYESDDLEPLTEETEASGDDELSLFDDTLFTNDESTTTQGSVESASLEELENRVAELSVKTEELETLLQQTEDLALAQEETIEELEEQLRTIATTQESTQEDTSVITTGTNSLTNQESQEFKEEAALTETVALTEALKDLEETKTTLEETFSELEQAKADLEASKEGLEQSLAELTTAKEELDSTKDDLSTTKEELEGATKELEELQKTQAESGVEALKNQIEELEQELESAQVKEEELATAYAELTTAKELAEMAKQEATQAKEDLETAQQESVELKERLDLAQKESTEAKENLESLQKEAMQAKAALEVAQKESTELKERLTTLEEELATSENAQEIARLQTTLEERSKELNTSKAQYQEAKDAEAELQRDIRLLKSEFDQIQQELAEALGDVKLLEASQAEIVKALDETHLEELKAQIATMEEENKELKATSTTLREKKKEDSKKLKDLRKAKRDLTKEVKELQAELANTPEDFSEKAALLEETTKGLEELTLQRDTLQSNITKLEEKLTTQSATLTETEKAYSSLLHESETAQQDLLKESEEKLAALRAELQEEVNQLTTKLEEAPTPEELFALKERVLTLEEAVTTEELAKRRLATEIATTQEEKRGLEEIITQLKRQLAQLENQLTETQTKHTKTTKKHNKLKEKTSTVTNELKVTKVKLGASAGKNQTTALLRKTQAEVLRLNQELESQEEANIKLSSKLTQVVENNKTLQRELEKRDNQTKAQDRLIRRELTLKTGKLREMLTDLRDQATIPESEDEYGW